MCPPCECNKFEVMLCVFVVFPCCLSLPRQARRNAVQPPLLNQTLAALRGMGSHWEMGTMQLQPSPPHSPSGLGKLPLLGAWISPRASATCLSTNSNSWPAWSQTLRAESTEARTGTASLSAPLHSTRLKWVVSHTMVRYNGRCN